MYKSLYKFLFVVMLSVAPSAHAALPAMPEIPTALPDAVRQPLIAKRKPLAEKKLALIDEADRNKKQCANIVVGSEQHRACLEMQKDFNARVEILRSEFAQLAVEIDTAVDRNAVKITDTMVVDARNVPSGLPKSVDDAIPHTPSGERVRKGFEAIQDGDWLVALAWFKDARNKEPGNPGLGRLVDLAQFTLDYRTPDADTSARLAAIDRLLDEKLDEDLALALDDFNRNYLPKHPELLEKEKPRAQTPAVEKNSTPVQSTPLPNQNSANNSTVGAAAKSDDDSVARAAASQMAARERADAAFKQYEKKYGDRDAVGRASAVAKASRGDGYTNEELKAQLQKALIDYRKEYRKNHPDSSNKSVGGDPAVDDISIGVKQ